MLEHQENANLAESTIGQPPPALFAKLLQDHGDVDKCRDNLFQKIEALQKQKEIIGMSTVVQALNIQFKYFEIDHSLGKNNSLIPVLVNYRGQEIILQYAPLTGSFIFPSDITPSAEEIPAFQIASLYLQKTFSEKMKEYSRQIKENEDLLSLIEEEKERKIVS